MPDERIHLNGINALTGEYLVPPLSTAEAAAMARQTAPPPQTVGWFGGVLEMLTARKSGLPVGVEPTDLSQAGWAVVFTPDTPDEVRTALQPLIEHRARQAPADRRKVLTYTPGQTREQWLAQHGAHGSDVEPTRVPYYVLLVGGPEGIPFEFQYELDVDYAVGRLAFDRPEDYGRYVESVLAYETDGAVANAREAVFWGPRHDADAATRLSADYLINPLFGGEPAAGGTPVRPPITERFKFRSRCYRGDKATRAWLQKVLHSRDQPPPSLLFTASHGMGWPRGDPRQRSANGALLCQDWPGLGRIKPEHYLSSAEIGVDARLRGLVAFVFACYGAGTPRYDNFLRWPGKGPVEIAEQPFVAALPQRLLAGGALAVVGHVERAWGYSIQPPGVGAQLLPFRNLVGRVLQGDPVGHATLDFSQRYATASVALLNKVNPALPGTKPATDDDLAWTWVERNDAQNYVVLGDPAVRLRSDELK